MFTACTTGKYKCLLTGIKPKNWKEPDAHSFFLFKHYMKNFKLVTAPIRKSLK